MADVQCISNFLQDIMTIAAIYTMRHLGCGVLYKSIEMRRNHISHNVSSVTHKSTIVSGEHYAQWTTELFYCSCCFTVKMKFVFFFLRSFVHTCSDTVKLQNRLHEEALQQWTTVHGCVIFSALRKGSHQTAIF